MKILERGHWASKAEFLLAVAGNVVGLGNVWRFPYLCYKYGGGAFLVPYLLFVVTCGVPLFLLETTTGQYTQEGAITCWRKLCPLAEDPSEMRVTSQSSHRPDTAGLDEDTRRGYAVSIHAWKPHAGRQVQTLEDSKAKLSSSPNSSIPPAPEHRPRRPRQRATRTHRHHSVSRGEESPVNTGDPAWRSAGAKPVCASLGRRIECLVSSASSSCPELETAAGTRNLAEFNIILPKKPCRNNVFLLILSDNCVDISSPNNTFKWTNQTNATSAATEFWERRVLALSGGIEDIGGIRWEVLLCLIALWIICYFCVWKGVRSTGKVVYFTATLPYVMLFTLLIRGLSLPGALEGVKFYLLPEPSHLTDPQVWMEAGAQIFFSYSVGVGTLAVLGSYNTYNNNCYRDCLWLCLLNSGTSVVAGFAVFSVLGFMAHEQGVPIARVAESGPGLAFIAYPQAVAMMPVPQLWSVCFFFLLILLGLDTHFVVMEVVMTSITDMFPRIMRRAGRRERFLVLFCLICFFSQLIMITEGGMYVFQLLDYYACNGACIFFLCVFECLALGWVFGTERICVIIKDMTGLHPNPFFKICWRYLTPLVSLGTFICSLIKYQPLTFNRWYVYPTWAYVLGWVLALSSILCVPGLAVYKLCTESATLSQRFRVLCQPDRSLSQKEEAELEQMTGETLNKRIIIR
ncbi:LOW QUALITY PROTEIN: sodium- and chloride-dependent GABA transporter 2-like [Thalassophryne amazonica]|uniref:LOW QUALITY PROTEIN: sodium- and chloride-dependent GABA transporter 2-like n=1 Tax=Thalassophryne amazonica TaxID=390379 RepID=UPI00147198DA|nr:LOW QUALITY PROTEIN: sodium- and chloride-dependent GABA transporter 2-like [Thalassophryne amazonica]